MPKAAFLDRLKTHQATKPIMTLAHTTNAANLYRILKDDLIKTSHEFRGKPTLYFFYGVNFYRQTATFNDAKSRPVGFLFKNDILNLAESVFPFDTGAYDEGLYGDYLDSDLMEYEVPILDKETPAKLVNILYETNESYLFGKPRPLKTAKTLTEHNLIEFIKDATTKIVPSDKFDDRCFAMEIQFIKNLKFKENVELIILPIQSYKENLEGLLEDELTGLNIEFYDDISVFGPSGDSLLIRQKAMDYLRKQGILV